MCDWVMTKQNQPISVSACVFDPNKSQNQMDGRRARGHSRPAKLYCCLSYCHTHLLLLPPPLPRRRHQIPTAIPPQSAPAREIGSRILNFSAQGSLNCIELAIPGC